ncbi:oligosaccharide flippase family protein [Paenibacillus hamazuiensis]|uniref:oligosaccharide flippase family protein n=1 Tax=Paenibacillus hamazuiensis TaxID=2936508 RepID=UPI00200F9BB8|nr:oligosaccharide flippase family protein [Paenibacillus hamazuiensis]
MTPWRKLTSSLNENQRFLLKSVAIIELGLFINQLLQTLGSIVLARVMNDPVQFGEVNLLLQIQGMVALFLNIGFNSALVYSFSTDKEEALQHKFRWALFGSSLFGVLISIALCALAPILSHMYGLPSLEGALMLSGIMLIFNSICNIGLSSFSGNRDFSVQALFMVVTTVFSTAGTVAGVLLPFPFGNKLWGVAFWMGVGSILTTLFICWKVEKVHRPKWRGTFSFKELRKMMAFGIPMWAGNIAKAFQQPFLVMVIGSSSVAAVGYLANGLRITGFIGIVTWVYDRHLSVCGRKLEGSCGEPKTGHALHPL